MSVSPLLPRRMWDEPRYGWSEAWSKSRIRWAMSRVGWVPMVIGMPAGRGGRDTLVGWNSQHASRGHSTLYMYNACMYMYHTLGYNYTCTCTCIYLVKRQLMFSCVWIHTRTCTMQFPHKLHIAVHVHVVNKSTARYSTCTLYTLFPLIRDQNSQYLRQRLRRGAFPRLTCTCTWTRTLCIYCRLYMYIYI